MYVRCPDCNASTWVAGADGQIAAAFTCKRCAAFHDLDGIAELGATSEDRHNRAVEFADRNGVDLASAYSMMLGLMPEPAEPVPIATTVTADPAEPGGEAVHYDPGFEKAVQEGLLTPEQALEQGDRNAAATRLANRHPLPLQFALDVVDHRMSILEAVEKAPPLPVEIVEAAPANSWQKAMVGSLAALLCVAFGFYGWGRWTEVKSIARRAEARTVEARPAKEEIGRPAAAPTVAKQVATTAAKPVATADVRTDDVGRLLMISARSPRAVLDAFCESGSSAGRYRAEEIVPSSHGTKVGVLRDIQNLEQSLGILIRRDRSTGRWSAGNGLEPIVLASAPD